MGNSLAPIVTLIKDIVNIIFFIAVGIMGVLTYLQAKKTIFMPIRTETFKLQLKLFEDIFAFIEENNRDLFINTFEYRKIFKINAWFLLDVYAETFFAGKIEINKDMRNQMLAEAPIINMAFKHKDKIESTDDGLILDVSYAKNKAKDSTDKLADWKQYEYVAVHITNHFQGQMDQLGRFISSPLLPNKIKALVREFQVGAYRNLHIMAEVFTEAAKELPTKYPSPESLLNANRSWIWNMFIEKRVRLEELSDKIYDHINEYLNTERLLK